MSAALLTKLKASGRPKGIEAELERFHSWLPTEIQPVNSAIRVWVTRFKAEETVNGRLKLEVKALRDVRSRVLHAHGSAHISLLAEFIDLLATGIEKSMRARRQTLAGAYIKPDLEDQLEDHVRSWLLRRERGPDRAMFGYLLRLMETWRQQRRAVLEADDE